jgi:general nucleoside transport system permease protein
MLLGMGLAFYLGKPLIQPQAPQIPSIALGDWLGAPAGSAVQSALNINVLFPIGVLLALALSWGLKHTGWGLTLRMVGDSADAARALGTSVTMVRVAATTAGGFIAGLGGASLSLYFPGSWNEALSSGQGLIAVALVIFARWHPVRCLWAALLFGGAGALGPALQSVGVSGYYYLFNAVPYVLTLAILVWTCSPRRSLQGAPMELGVTR